MNEFNPCATKTLDPLKERNDYCLIFKIPDKWLARIKAPCFYGLENGVLEVTCLLLVPGQSAFKLYKSADCG